jgi:hypothetical protein
MSPFDDTAWLASEQSSREVLKRPLVTALTPTMSDAATRAAFRICITVCCLSVRSLTYCRCGCQADEAYHWTMSRTYSECPDSADVVLRQEPDEEEDEEEDEGDGEEGDDADDRDDGYSE